MPVNVRCPACSGLLRIADANRGKRVKCPKCAHIFAEAGPARAAPAAAPTAAPAAAPAAAPKKPVKKTVLNKSGDAAADPLDRQAIVPMGPAQVDSAASLHVSATKPAARQSPNMTIAHTSSSQAVDETHAPDGRQIIEFEVTQADDSRVRNSTPDGNNLMPLPEDMPKALGGFEILKELGRGGMGTVYLARQKSLDRLVALKVMSARRAKDPTFVARFMREAYAAAQISHHNVVQIYD